MFHLTNLRTVCLLRKWQLLSYTEVLHQVSNKNIIENYNNIAIFYVSIMKKIETEKLNSPLHNANCRWCVFFGATLKHYNYIRPTLNEINLIMDIVQLHMITNEITN